MLYRVLPFLGVSILMVSTALLPGAFLRYLTAWLNQSLVTPLRLPLSSMLFSEVLDNMLYSNSPRLVAVIFGDLSLLKVFANIATTSSQMHYPDAYFVVSNSLMLR